MSFSRTPHRKRHASPVRSGTLSLVREFFNLVENVECVSITDLADRAGYARATPIRWTGRHGPTLKAFEDHLNALGYELKIVKRENT
ncbi:hypothetical protein [Pyruvatibacter mobilis]|jgi:hypothetical protein|uniref:hypothetical protein n=1 Tax=Pyruvatibacter mobilis TaxID=1712261 RepID=UPI003C7E2E80